MRRFGASHFFGARIRRIGRIVFRITVAASDEFVWCGILNNLKTKKLNNLLARIRRIGRIVFRITVAASDESVWCVILNNLKTKKLNNSLKLTTHNL